MKKKISYIVIIGCLLILANMSIATVSAMDFEMEHSEPLIPIVQTCHADAGKPYSGSVGQIINFDGSGTFINNYATYKWDFGDGTIGYGKYPSHYYSAPGVYYVSLKVETNDGRVYMDDTLVYIDQENDHLVPYGGCYYQGNIEETITFDASDSVSNDPNLPIVEYNWYFSDGTTKTGEQVTHSFDEARVYTVTLYVEDNEGNTRRDFLHADINQDYTSKMDFYANVDNTLEQMLDVLINWLSGPLLNYFDTKIYYNLNDGEYEDTIDINSLNQLPLHIDVNDNGVDDVILNDIEVFKQEWGPSLFADQGMDWYQYETTFSNLEKTSGSDIGIDDDFTICLQFNFGSTLAGWLGLETPLVRIGYNSPAGEELPESVTLTHIFKPYLLQRWTNQNPTGGGSTPQGTTTTGGVVETFGYEPMGTGITEGGAFDSGGLGEGEPIVLEEENLEINAETEEESIEVETHHEYVATPHEPYTDLEDEYWPEYGLKLDSTGGSKFSLVRMFG